MLAINFYDFFGKGRIFYRNNTDFSEKEDKFYILCQGVQGDPSRVGTFY